MAEKTGIEWSTATWNPHVGCHRVSEGCQKCYAFRDMKRFGKSMSDIHRSAPPTFYAPDKWRKNNILPPGSRIFVCSWSDFFLVEADDWRNEEWKIIREHPEYIFQIPTKRPERIATHLPEDWGAGYENVWLGFSAENQKWFDLRYQFLDKIPCRVRWVSMEPLLGPIKMNGEDIHWVVDGGESDFVSPRKAQLQWFRDIRDYCKANGIAYFHKQNGGSKKIEGAWGGKRLDGEIYQEFPNAIHPV